MVKHPWHEVSPGPGAPESLLCVVEIPKGSKAKYEIHKPSGLLLLDRVLFSSVHYPTHYGFIPRSLGEDGDPLDVLVISSVEVQALCLVQADVIGMMEMRDTGKSDEKIIAVARNDMGVSHIHSMNELPPHLMAELKRFFQDYKALEQKEVIVDEFLGKEKALTVIRESFVRYNQKYGSKFPDPPVEG